jgi:putative transposase
MAEYRRWYVPGGTYFFTLVTYRRQPLFKAPEARRLLGNIMRKYAVNLPFQTIAIVLLPDHIHCLWSLPTEDVDYSIRWKKIKRDFTCAWLEHGKKELAVSNSRRKRGGRGVWQRRFWEHVIRDELDLERHCDYIHYNPVKHGYVKQPWDWTWSTFRRFVAAGQYPRDWGKTEPSHLHDMDLE